MALSRRGFLFAFGLAVPASAILSDDAEAATTSQNRRRKPSGQANAKPKKNARQGKAHASSGRRRRQTTS